MKFRFEPIGEKKTFVNELKDFDQEPVNSNDQLIFEVLEIASLPVH